VLNGIAVGLILLVQFPLLVEIRLRGFVGMLILLVASWSVGWLFGGRDAGTRSFPGTPAVTAVAAYALFALLGTLALALVIGRLRTDSLRCAAGP
jgi:BASS family bile acid:Na+ symporter